jgi:hypothetical protein
MVQIGRQDDLLNWQPPAPVKRFDDDKVRAGSVAGRVCRAVSLSLKESGVDRSLIAERMSEFLGEEVSKNMLDAYSSQAREEHVINVVRFIALIHATRDRRLLEMVAEMFGWAVIERRYLKLIELASLNEHRDELRQRADAARRQAKSEGLL